MQFKNLLKKFISVSADGSEIKETAEMARSFREELGETAKPISTDGKLSCGYYL